MFQTKRARIAVWLKSAPPSPFSALLTDWLDGSMAQRLGLTKPEFHIDWTPDYKCINIQGRFGADYVDIQIEPDSFTIAMDPDEPDEPTEFPLESPEQFYQTVHNTL